MGDVSQSRYSIVERLTQTKLDLIGAKSDLDEEISRKEQMVKKHKKDLEGWKETVKLENAKKEREMTSVIEHASFDLEETKKRKANTIKTYEAKLAAIDTALAQIGEISKSNNPQ